VGGLVDIQRFENTVAHLDSGEVEGALREFEKLADSESKREEKSSLLLNQVACLMRLGRLADARGRLSEAVQFWDSLYAGYFDLSLCVAEGRATEAMSKLVDFLKRRQDLAQSGDEDLCSDAAEKVGCLLFERRQFGDATQPFKEALVFSETPERRNRVCLYLAICYIQTNDLGAADRIFRDDLVVDRNDELWPTVQYQLGRLRFKMGDWAKARRAFEFSQLSTADEELRNNIPFWLNQIDVLLAPDKQRPS